VIFDIFINPHICIFLEAFIINDSFHTNFLKCVFVLNHTWQKMLNQHFYLGNNINFFQGNNVPFKNINQKHIVMWPNEYNIFNTQTFSFPHLEKYEAFELSCQNCIENKWLSCSTTWSIGIESCNNKSTVLLSNNKMTFTTPMCVQVD
jgi:hypothetical protein